MSERSHWKVSRKNRFLRAGKDLLRRTIPLRLWRIAGLLRARGGLFVTRIRARLEHKIYVPQLVLFPVDTCNLRCANCGASSPYTNDANLPDLESFVQSLSFLSRTLRCDELAIAGGETLLNKDLCSFMRAARQSGIFNKIKVVTNGLLLPKMSEEFWELADIVQISLYPVARDILSEAKLETLKATAFRSNAKLAVVPFTHFYKWMRESRMEDEHVVQHTFSSCDEAHEWSCHTLYRNHLYRCSVVHTMDRYLTQIGTDHARFTDEDGLLIDGRASLLDDLRNYLASAHPLKACSFCLGTNGPQEEHRQLTVEEIRSKLNRTKESV